MISDRAGWKKKLKSLGLFFFFFFVLNVQKHIACLPYIILFEKRNAVSLWRGDQEVTRAYILKTVDIYNNNFDVDLA